MKRMRGARIHTFIAYRDTDVYREALGKYVYL